MFRGVSCESLALFGKLTISGNIHVAFIKTLVSVSAVLASFKRLTIDRVITVRGDFYQCCAAFCLCVYVDTQYIDDSCLENVRAQAVVYPRPSTFVSATLDGLSSNLSET